MALALALAAGRQAGSQKAGFCAHWGFASAPVSLHFPRAWCPSSDCFPGSSQAPAALLGPFSTCLSTHSGLILMRHPTQARPAVWALAVRGLGRSCRAHREAHSGSTRSRSLSQNTRGRGGRLRAPCGAAPLGFRPGSVLGEKVRLPDLLLWPAAPPGDPGSSARFQVLTKNCTTKVRGRAP